ncbi:carboxylesterase family protein [Corynebacterium sp. 335C]
MNKSRPQWSTPDGDVAGVSGDGVDRALGIRYAVGGRYEVPRPVEPHDDLLIAETPAAACPQTPPSTALAVSRTASKLRVDEDCQRLSVHVPAGLPADAGAPVMVWVHGGAYVSGSGDLPGFDPRRLVTEQRVVVVTVTYRLGMFGFLGDGDVAPANLGLMDIREALRWVRRNIGAFGGDPAKVTAFGQSAGADAIVALMVADGHDMLEGRADGPLFDRAIVQSAPFGMHGERGAMTDDMLAAAGPLSKDMPVEEMLEAEGRATEAAQDHGLFANMPFGPQYGHDPLPPRSGVDAALKEVAPRVEVLVGHTTREAALFSEFREDAQRARRMPFIGDPLMEAITRHYTRITYGPMKRFVDRHAAGGGRGATYRLDWGPAGSLVRSAHIIDIPLLLGDEDSWSGSSLIEGLDWAVVDADGRRMRAAWAEFARDGRLSDAGIGSSNPPAVGLKGSEPFIRFREFGPAGTRPAGIGKAAAGQR